MSVSGVATLDYTSPSVRAFRVRCPVCGADAQRPCSVDPMVHEARKRAAKER